MRLFEVDGEETVVSVGIIRDADEGQDIDESESSDGNLTNSASDESDEE